MLVDHPLTGRIYEPSKHGFTTRAQLDSAVHAAHFLMLGEKHDNRDHHRLQADLLRVFLRSRPDPAVAFEMLDVAQQPDVDRFLAAHPRSVDGFDRAVNWGDSGWPAWSMYRPVFAAALEGGARIVAANLPRADAMSVATQGDKSPILGLLSLVPLPQPQLDAMAKEMGESHCGALPDSMLPGMVLAQRARDATIAAHVREADHGSGVALVCGDGHARKDRGVPVALQASPSQPVLSIAFIEVYRGEADPASYVDAAEPGKEPFDFVWFTPRVDEKDPCEQMHMPK